MFASNLRNEFAIVIFGYSDITKNFLLINSGRSILTRRSADYHVFPSYVSIVSIQADQSRHIEYGKKEENWSKAFQSYQFRQINPDVGTRVTRSCKLGNVSIVSIQADQSRHENGYYSVLIRLPFQSYQFRQINPDHE